MAHLNDFGFGGSDGESIVEPNDKTVLVAGDNRRMSCRSEIEGLLSEDIGLRQPQDYTIEERSVSKRKSAHGEPVYSISIEFKDHARMQENHIAELGRILDLYDINHEQEEVAPTGFAAKSSASRGRMRPVNADPKNARVYELPVALAGKFHGAALDASMQRGIGLIEGQDYSIQGDLVEDGATKDNAKVRLTLQFNIGTAIDKVPQIEALLKALEPQFGKPKTGRDLGA